MQKVPASCPPTNQSSEAQKTFENGSENMLRRPDIRPALPTKIVVAKSGDITHERGTFRVTVDDESGKPAEYSGKHLVAWEKRGGHWKVAAESIHRDSPRVRRRY
jgi:ketosteroid isomerase-like protein